MISDYALNRIVGLDLENFDIDKKGSMIDLFVQKIAAFSPVHFIAELPLKQNGNENVCCSRDFGR